jgi:hypothetical protein
VIGVDRSQYHSVSVSVSTSSSTDVVVLELEDSPISSSDTVNNPNFAGSCILICLARARLGE